MKLKLTLLAATLCASPAFATTAWDPGLGAWVTTYDAASYGATGTITFNDWGYKGPTVGGYTVGANDFQVGTGFNAGSIGQIQHVVTKAPDYLTSDPASNVVGDLGAPNTNFTNANMDGGVNFYQWGYTTPANSTFNNMQIDTAGNYHIAKQDMSFGKYDMFEYRDMTGTNPNQSFDTRINFKPYTVSDAKGWCGSVLTPNPGGLAQMAGQVTFDFAMDVYFDFGGPEIFSATQLVPGFVMRSYGDYKVNVTTGGGDLQSFEGHAVGNNTNPESIVAGVGGTLDPAFQNDVSFLGAGVLPRGVWVSADSFNPDGTRKMRTDHNATTGENTLVWDVTIVDAGTAGAVWHGNSYAGFAYVLRADGMRILDYVNPTGHSDYVTTAVPEPESYAMMLIGVGLVGGMAARRRRPA
ncbi:MAG: PEP-CTERM sorting domain-containing protein [Thiobacillus sp.]